MYVFVCVRISILYTDAQKVYLGINKNTQVRDVYVICMCVCMYRIFLQTHVHM